MSDIHGYYDYYVWTAEAGLDQSNAEKLHALLDDGRPAFDTVAQNDSDLSLLVIPRPGTVSPWASKATDSAKNCGLEGIRRIERGLRYVLTPKRGLLGAKDISTEQLGLIADVLHDRMTETVVDSSFTGAALFKN